jgi:hypothetical protein
VILRPMLTVASASPAAFLSGSHVAAVILASAAAAVVVLPLLGRALKGLPDWGMSVLDLREAVRDKRAERRRKRRAARRSRRRRSAQ